MGGEEHPLVEWHQDAVKDFVPQRNVNCPNGQLTYSTPHDSAGNVRTDEEANAIIDLALENRVYGFPCSEYTGNANSDITAGAQNYYWSNPTKPHTPV